MPTISLIVATYNWPEALNVCLLSIKHQTVFPCEVIIADDGSTPVTKSLIDSYKKTFPVPLIHVWHEDNGFRKSLILNKGVLKASGDYIVQIDGDVILDKHFITDHLSVAEKGFFVRGTRAHIRKDRVGRVLKQGLINLNYFSPGLMHRFNALRIPKLAFLIEMKASSSDRVRGSNLAFWRSDFILVNGYDNDLTGWGHEDEELAARFINNGIWKKSVKFKCVQYHLYHTERSYSQKAFHVSAVDNTRQKSLKACTNGIAQS
ncbi:glycosyltransferase family 2 protein [Arcticibacter sp.]|uniref:glycosyltransferase family 2 protein n=1 Tax=Arcticibacter sp. TaxID=1872630 RepID=UPI003890B060